MEVMLADVIALKAYSGKVSWLAEVARVNVDERGHTDLIQTTLV